MRSPISLKLKSSILFFAVVSGLSACSKEPATAPAAGGGTAAGGGAADGGKGPIRIGEYGSMTGSEANFGQSTHNGLVLAIEEQNAKGGINGRKIELVSYDDQGREQEAGTVVTRLIQKDKVLAIIGEVASSRSLAGGEVCQGNGVPMISPSSTNPRVTLIGDMIFRVCFIDPFQGYVVAKFATENLKMKKAAILFDQSQPYSKDLGDVFEKNFTQMGGTISSRQAYGGGDQDYSAQLTTIRGTNPEALFIPGYYNEAANIALQVRKLGINATLLGGDGWDSPQLAAIGKDAIEGSYYSNHYTHEDTRPAVQEFVTKYKGRYQGLIPDGIAALGYDAGRVLFDAMGRARSLAGKDLAAAIAATQDFQGVTGVITIDASRNASKDAVMVKMQDGIPRFAATIARPQ